MCGNLNGLPCQNFAWPNLSEFACSAPPLCYFCTMLQENTHKLTWVFLAKC